MTRAITLLLLLAGCSKEVELPGAFFRDARHLLIAPETLPTCGLLSGRITAVGADVQVEESDEAYLLQFLDGAFEEIPADQPIAVVRIDGTFDERLTGTAPLTDISAAWRLTGTEFELIDDPPVADLRAVVEPACEALAHARCDILEPRLCPTYEASTFRIPNSASTAAFALGVRTGSSRALVAARGGLFYEVTAEGLRETSVAPGTPALAGFTRTDGQTWLVGPDGAVASGTPEAGFTTGPSVPDAAMSSADLEGAADGPLELVLLTDERRLLRYDGAAWSVLAALPRLRELVPVQLTRIDGDDLLAFFPYYGAFRYRNGALEELDLGVSPEFLTAATWSPTLGLVVGTNDDQLLVDGGAIDGPGGNQMLSIEPFDDGVVYGDLLGGLFYYSELTGHCLVTSVATAPWRIVPLDDGFVVLSKNRYSLTGPVEQTDHVIAHVTRIHSPDVCR